jgi:hypothetical protein
MDLGNGMSHRFFGWLRTRFDPQYRAPVGANRLVQWSEALLQGRLSLILRSAGSRAPLGTQLPVQLRPCHRS